MAKADVVHITSQKRPSPDAALNLLTAYAKPSFRAVLREARARCAAYQWGNCPTFRHNTIKRLFDEASTQEASLVVSMRRVRFTPDERCELDRLDCICASSPISTSGNTRHRLAMSCALIIHERAQARANAVTRRYLRRFGIPTANDSADRLAA